MARSDCLLVYETELKQFCSSHEQRQLMKVKQFLLDIRFFVLSKFQTMMLSYQEQKVYKQYLGELKKTLSEKEEECIRYFKQLIFKFKSVN